MFITDQTVIEPSKLYLYFLMEEIDRFGAAAWTWTDHLSLCKALSNK